ncbi:MAG: SMP-30/gluconolactonase/LRE family protein [Candidatus Latescibacterota bacterium]
MARRNQVSCGKALLALLCCALVVSGSVHAENVDFQSDKWNQQDAQIVRHMGRSCLIGTAYLQDVLFQNGVIEVDVAVSGERSYPGVIFRMQSEENYERVYLRPHRAGLYPDAIQYTPVFNNVEAWQLYNGTGYTAAADIPPNQWLHIKIEVRDSRARIYLNNSQTPVLEISDLKHGISEGTIGLLAPKNQSAFFSNFQYHADDSLQFDLPSEAQIPEGVITNWEISKAFNAEKIDLKTGMYPRFYTIFSAGWREVTSEASGLVNVSRYARRSGQAPDCILARKIFRSADKKDINLSFGYSDEASVFLNGKKLFYGNSAYRYRDPSFLGIVGYYDTVCLPLEKGLNEIFLVVKERFGGWGFMCQTDALLDEPVKQHERLSKLWETPPQFLTPESVQYDPDRDILYVSNFDNRYNASATSEDQYTGYISKIKLNGEIEQLKWVSGLHAPCGLGIYHDKLYTVERNNLTEIDIETGKIENRYPVPGADFMNDLVIDSDGNIFISDTSPSSPGDSRIYRCKDGKVDVWMDGIGISRANGLFIHDGKLLVGNSGDGCLKSVDLRDKRITTVTSLGAGTIDGIRVDAAGNYLVSHWEGRTYVVSPEGDVTQILDTMGEGLNSADFEFIMDKKLLIIPTFTGNKVVAYRLM